MLGADNSFDLISFDDDEIPKATGLNEQSTQRELHPKFMAQLTALSLNQKNLLDSTIPTRSSSQPATRFVTNKAVATSSLVDLSMPPPILPSNRQTFKNLDRYENAVFLFADIKDYSILSQDMDPELLSTMLNGFYSKFFDIVEKYGHPYGIQTVKVMGDCIMLCGASHDKAQTKDQIAMMVYLGYTMSQFMFSHNLKRKEQIDFRFGINVGPASKFKVNKPLASGGIESTVDWIGEGVNKASRMESSSYPNQVQVTAPIYETVKEYFDFSPAKRTIKSYGELHTSFVIRPRDKFYTHFRLEKKMDVEQLTRPFSPQANFTRKMSATKN